MSSERFEASPEKSDETLLKWEVYLRANRVIPPEGQDELRRLLQLHPQSDVRERLIRLLNPRGAAVIELSDWMFNNCYDRVTTDNYAGPFCPDPYDRNAAFDAAHGYYVAPIIDPDLL